MLDNNNNILSIYLTIFVMPNADRDLQHLTCVFVMANADGGHCIIAIKKTFFLFVVRHPTNKTSCIYD